MHGDFFLLEKDVKQITKSSRYLVYIVVYWIQEIAFKAMFLWFQVAKVKLGQDNVSEARSQHAVSLTAALPYSAL